MWVHVVPIASDMTYMLLWLLPCGYSHIRAIPIASEDPTMPLCFFRVVAVNSVVLLSGCGHFRAVLNASVWLQLLPYSCGYFHALAVTSGAVSVTSVQLRLFPVWLRLLLVWLWLLSV